MRNILIIGLVAVVLYLLYKNKQVAAPVEPTTGLRYINPISGGGIITLFDPPAPVYANTDGSDRIIVNP